MSRFVRPVRVLLTLANGDTITVKERLSAGEQRAMFVRMRRAGDDDLLRVDPMQVGLARLTAYLLDWSLTDDAGQRVEIRDRGIAEVEAILNSLDPDAFQEISVALDAHIGAVTAARAQEKKTQSGESTS